MRKGFDSLWAVDVRERTRNISYPFIVSTVYNRRILELCNLERESDIYFSITGVGKILGQFARCMVNKYAKEAFIDLHITPYMFCHAFADLLLEEDVGIRYIQKMLGCSSVVITTICEQIVCKKQMNILEMKHPQNKMQINVSLS